VNPTLAALVRERTGATWTRARALCAEGRVLVDGQRCLDPAMRVAPGAVIVVNESGPRTVRGPLPREAIVHLDRDVVIVDKPAGMLSVADEEGARDTLAEYLRVMLRRIEGVDAKLGVVHRLDRETSGLMAFARTASAQRTLAAQFRAHEIDRVYRAIAHGDVHPGRIESYLVEDRGDGLRGSFGRYKRVRGDPPVGARRSVTFVEPLEALLNATLVECRLETGRQHQIRIHLAERGNPVVGEKVYVRDFKGIVIDAPRAMLHARTLGFEHPATGKAMSFMREPPEDFVALWHHRRPKGPSND
jgi:23S rRNA pseudouridine1911/1915/1917 synthase